MNLHPYLLRACYLRTLHRFVGPFMGWRVRDVANDLRRADPLPGNVRKGGGSDPRPSPTSHRVNSHDGAINGFSA